MRIELSLSLALVVTSCVSTPEPERYRPRPAIPAVKPTPPPVVPPANAGNWDDWPRAPGNWVYRADGRGSVALFGLAGQDASFLIRCDRSARKIYLSRAGSFADGDSGRMTVRATSGLQTYPVANAGGTPAYISAEVQPADPNLDAMAYSRGKFLISVKGATDLVIPSWPEFARVVEDCR